MIVLWLRLELTWTMLIKVAIIGANGIRKPLSWRACQESSHHCWRSRAGDSSNSYFGARGPRKAIVGAPLRQSGILSALDKQKSITALARCGLTASIIENSPKFGINYPVGARSRKYNYQYNQWTVKTMWYWTNRPATWMSGCKEGETGSERVQGIDSHVVCHGPDFLLKAGWTKSGTLIQITT